MTDDEMLLWFGLFSPGQAAPSTSDSHSQGHGTEADEFHATVVRFCELHSTAPRPAGGFQTEHDRAALAFDVGRYFDVLTRLTLSEGLALDYVMAYSHNAARPVLYVRSKDAKPYQTLAEYGAAEGGLRNVLKRETTRRFLSSIRADGSPESFLQLVLLSEVGGQFYLVWHAGYFDTQIIASRAAIQDLLASRRPTEARSGIGAFDQSQVDEMEKIDPTPSVTFRGDGTIDVAFCTFTNWGGLFRKGYRLQRSFPHEILDVKKTTIVPYEISIVF